MIQTTTETTVTGTLSRQRPATLWRNRDYLLLWLGHTLSGFGSQLSALAFPLLVLWLTGSPGQAGLVGALRGLPTVLLTLPAGALVDRWDRRRVMMACDLGRALALGSVPLALFVADLTLVQIAIVSVIEGAFATFFMVAKSAAIPQLVSKAQLGQALSQQEVGDALIQLVGPAVSGALYQVGRMLPFVIDALSYGVSMVTIWLIRTPFQEARQRVEGQRLRAEVSEGVRWVWRHPVLRALAGLTGGLMVCSIGYPLIMIVLSRQIGASDLEIGLIFAGGGAGSIIGAVLASWLQRRVRFGHLMIVGSWLWALTWLFPLLAHSVLALALANAAAFVIVPIFLVAEYAYRLAVTPDALQGRMNAVFRLIVFGSQPLGLALAGWLLERAGTYQTLVVLFVPQLVFSIAATWHRSLRQERWPD